MKKTIRASILVLALALMAMVTPAFAAEDVALPEYDYHILTEAERDEFFALESMNTSYGDPAVCYLYDALKAAGNADVIQAVNYTATESYNDASAQPYAEYMTDFEISSAEDVSVMLIGNYGSYGTIPVGIVNVAAGESIRVMQSAASIGALPQFTYQDIVLLVKDFDCAAIPLTEEVLKAYHTVLCDTDASFKAAYPEYNAEVEAMILAGLVEEANPLGAESFTVVDGNTGLTLSLNLYETVDKEETGKSWAVASNIFVPYESHVLTKTERDAFFNGEYKYGGDVVNDIYNKIEDQDGVVYAMNFKAVDDYDTAAASPYAYYIADFELTSSKDTSVLLVGNYGSYGTIPIGIVNLTANTPKRIMQTTREAGMEEWNLNYKEVVLTVGSFDCAAIPVSTEMLKAYYDVKCEQDASYKASNPVYTVSVGEAILAELAVTEGCNPLGAESFMIAEDDTELSLTLNLYENDNSTPNSGETKYDETGDSWVVGDTSTFTYNIPEFMQDMLVIWNMDVKQDAEDESVSYYPIHVYSGIDSLNYSEVGYTMNVTNTVESTSASKTKSTRIVYESMNVTDLEGTKELYSAYDLGGNYMFGHELLFTVGEWTNENAKIEITPYAKTLAGEEIVGKTVTLTDAIVKEYKETTSLFREENK